MPRTMWYKRQDWSREEIGTPLGPCTQTESSPKFPTNPPTQITDSIARPDAETPPLYKQCCMYA